MGSRENFENEVLRSPKCRCSLEGSVASRGVCDNESVKCYAGSGLPQGPFLESNLFPLKVGLRWAFVNGLKCVQKWAFGCKNGSKWVETHFSPLWAHFENPLFSQFKGGGNCFLKRAPRQSRPSMNEVKVMKTMNPGALDRKKIDLDSTRRARQCTPTLIAHSHWAISYYLDYLGHCMRRTFSAFNFMRARMKNGLGGTAVSPWIEKIRLRLGVENWSDWWWIEFFDWALVCKAGGPCQKRDIWGWKYLIQAWTFQSRLKIPSQDS